MPTFEELREQAITLGVSGDIEGARRLAAEAKATQQFEILKERAISLGVAGKDKEAKELAEQAKALLAPFKEGKFTDIGRGIKAAPVTVAQGLMESGAAASDLIFGTEYSRSVSDAFENFKREYDLNPRSTGGQITEEIVSFGVGFIPIAGWLGRANQVARGAAKTKAKSKFFKAADKFGESAAGKKLLSTRAGLIGSTALATGGYEALVTPDGYATISDAFDSAPEFLKTEDTLALGGSELAGTRLRNKFRRGFEGGLASLTFDIGLPVIGAGARAIGSTPVVSEVSGFLAQGLKDVFNKATELAGKAPIIRNVKDPIKEKLAYWFSPTGTQQADILEEMFDARGSVTAIERQAVNYFREFEEKANKMFGLLPKYRSKRKNAELKEDFLNAYFSGNTQRMEEKYGAKVGKAFSDLFNFGQRMQDEVALELENVIARQEAEGMVLSADSPLKRALLQIQQNVQDPQAGYLRRRFDMYDDKENFYDALDFTGPKYQAALQEMKQHVRSTFAGPVTPDQMRELLPDVRPDIFSPVSRFDGTFDPNAPVDFTQIPEDVLDRFAEQKLLDYLRLDVTSGLSPQQALEAKRQSLKSVNRNQQAILPGREISIADDIFIERVKELDMLPSVRELMGEVRDPQKMFFRTISDTAQSLAGIKFYRGLADNVAIAPAKAVEILEAGGDLPPIIKDPLTTRLVDTFDSAEQAAASGLGREDMARLAYNTDQQVQLINRLEQAGYRRLAESVEDPSILGAFGDITSMYVSPAAADALMTPARLQADEIGQLGAIGAILKGQAQRMTVVANPISQIRNIFGNQIALAQGDMLPNRGDMVDAFRVVASNVADMNDEAFDRLSKELGTLGVMETNLVTSALRDFREMSKEFATSEKFQKFFDTTTSFLPFMGSLEKLYGNSDSFFKLLGVFSEQGKMATALGKAGVDVNNLSNFNFQAFKNAMVDGGLAKRSSSISLEDTPANFLLTMAGDTVKDLMPVYSRVGKAVKKLDALPVFGAFTSFASENIRNSVNTLSRGLKELSFGTDPKVMRDLVAAFEGNEAAARAFARQVRGMGSKRLLSYVAISNVAPAAITKASMLATGTSEDEMNAARAQAADFYDGSDLGVLSNDKRGKMELFNMSYIFPHSFVREPALDAIRTYNERGELNANEADQIFNGVWAGLKGFFEPFLGESLFAERVIDTLPTSWIGRGGNTQTGASIYSDSDSRGEQVANSMTHLFGTYIPGYARLFAEERGGDIVPGRVTRALTGAPGTRGQEYTGNEELARVLTGITPIVINNRTDFNFRGAEYTNLRSPAKGQATRTIKRADATPEMVVESWNKYLDDLYRAQSQLYYYVLAARRMNTSDDEIRKQLREANVGKREISSILRGEFWPGIASKEVIKETIRAMRAEDKNFLVKERPWGELNQLSNERRGQKLSPELFKEERDARLQEKRNNRKVETEAANSRIAEAATPQVEVPQVQPAQVRPETTAQAPVLPTQVQPQQSVRQNLAALMSSNPVDALKNLQIAERLGMGG